MTANECRVSFCFVLLFVYLAASGLSCGMWAV